MGRLSPVIIASVMKQMGWHALWAFLSRLDISMLAAYQGVCDQIGSENLRDPRNSLDLYAGVIKTWLISGEVRGRQS